MFALFLSVCLFVLLLGKLRIYLRWLMEMHQVLLFFIAVLL